MDQFAEEAVVFLGIPVGLFAELKFFALIIFIIKIMVDILDGFSVGELKVVLLVGRPVLRGGDVGDEPDGELLGVILDGRDVPGWGAATDGRTPRVYPIPVLPSDRRLIVLHVVVGISFGEDLRVVPLDPIHRQIRSCYS